MLRIDDDDSENRQESSENEVYREIYKLGDELIEYGNNLAITSEGEEFDKFNEMHQVFNERLKESCILLHKIYGDDKRKCEKQILLMIKTCSSMIKERRNTFMVKQKQWKEMNDRMSEMYLVVGPLLEGMNKRKLMTNSLYMFLQADSVEALDMFWQEYLDGTLKSKFMTTMYRSRDSGASISITVTENNYRRYRTYIGK